MNAQTQREKGGDVEKDFPTFKLPGFGEQVDTKGEGECVRILNWEAG